MTIIIKKPVIRKNSFERRAWEQKLYVCGIDEVGRGCLAGPVVVSAVILPLEGHHPLLKDSKVLTAEEREKAYRWITKHCQWSVAMCSNHVVDERNIYQATLYGMKKAYLQLIETMSIPLPKLKYVVIDAMPLLLDNTMRHKDLEVHHFNFGESLSTSIAAASIVAKVTRDRLMTKLDPIFPAFTFQTHKGYATKAHQTVLRAQGPTIIHRSSFISKFTNEEDDAQPASTQNVLFSELL